ncbi:MAG TPA: hypothetical protein VGV38_11010 [Pyrinomonadaceae bacterium]|nr:hypothetical protein [Pyrinomonadaceae bacterium]
MRSTLHRLIAAAILLASASCAGKERAVAPAREASLSPVSEGQQAEPSWPSDPTGFAWSPSEGLTRAWADFERAQPYRLARPSDRKVSQAVLESVRSDGSRYAVPYLVWWGARGLRKADGTDVIVAVVSDPGRSDERRYGLVVLAAPESDGGKYKVYWAAREEDMGNWLLSSASGNVFVHCFQRDGSEQTKVLAWDGQTRQFKLVPPRGPDENARPKSARTRRATVSL